jgi:hypothetical protein
LERAIDLAGRHGIFVVLGTPSQAPPEWLTQKYPEVLRVIEAGQRTPSNGRENFNGANPKYRELVRGIDEQLEKFPLETTLMSSHGRSITNIAGNRMTKIPKNSFRIG